MELPRAALLLELNSSGPSHAEFLSPSVTQAAAGSGCHAGCQSPALAAALLQPFRAFLTLIPTLEEIFEVSAPHSHTQVLFQ